MCKRAQITSVFIISINRTHNDIKACGIFCSNSTYKLSVGRSSSMSIQLEEKHIQVTMEDLEEVG